MPDPLRRRRLPAVVGAIIGATIAGAIALLSGTTLFVYNGLARAVTVTVDGEPLELLQHQAGQLPLRCLPGCDIETRTQDGVLVEAFRERLLPWPWSAANARIYNVAAASPLLLRQPQAGRATTEQVLPLQRWLAAPAARVFGMIVAGTPTTPEVSLAGAGELPPRELLGLAPTADDQLKLALVQARWAAADAQYADDWLQLLAQRKELPALLQARLSDDPEDPPARRLQRTMMAPVAPADAASDIVTPP